MFNNQILRKMERVKLLVLPKELKALFAASLAGFFDTFKSIIPTIGKVAMGVFNSLASSRGTRKVACYTVFGKTDADGNTTSGLHFLHNDGKLLVVNNAMNNSYSITIPRRGLNTGLMVHLAPLSQLDITDEISSASQANIQNFAISEMDPDKSTALGGSLGASILSCLGYFTKGNLATPFNLTAKIVLQSIGLDIQISLAPGLQIMQGQSLEVRSVGDGEVKRYNEVTPMITAEEDGTTVLVLKNALDGFKDEDELSLTGDIAFKNVEGTQVADRLGEGITDEVRSILTA
jgi:hypothetical protein